MAAMTTRLDGEERGGRGGQAGQGGEGGRQGGQGADQVRQDQRPEQTALLGGETGFTGL